MTDTERIASLEHENGVLHHESSDLRKIIEDLRKQLMGSAHTRSSQKVLTLADLDKAGAQVIKAWRWLEIMAMDYYNAETDAEAERALKSLIASADAYSEALHLLHFIADEVQRYAERPWQKEG